MIVNTSAVLISPYLKHAYCEVVAIIICIEQIYSMLVCFNTGLCRKRKNEVKGCGKYSKEYIW